jgi:hypothetical protein
MNQLGASGMPTVMKELRQKIENSIKITWGCQTTPAVACTYHWFLRHSSSTSQFCSLPGCALFFIILILLPAQSAVNPFSVDFLK